jgi:hypothetical protein
MAYPPNWNQLVEAERASGVFVARAFRPTNPECLQFTDSEGGEHLAVAGLSPYGETDRLVPEVQATLLDTETQGEDYTLLRVPQATLTLRQASFGSGKERTLDLKDSYRRLGRLARQLTDNVPSAPLGLADFGINKRTGKLILLPPLELGRGTQDRSVQFESIAASISKTFMSLLPPDVYGGLIEEVRDGFGEV